MAYGHSSHDALSYTFSPRSLGRLELLLLPFRLPSLASLGRLCLPSLGRLSALGLSADLATTGSLLTSGSDGLLGACVSEVSGGLDRRGRDDGS